LIHVSALEKGFSGDAIFLPGAEPNMKLPYCTFRPMATRKNRSAIHFLRGL
jgi:hypothetical protein